MAYIWTLFIACLSLAAAQKPAAIYDGGFGSGSGTNAAIRLRIGNGGAGQSGLIKALADAYIQDSVQNGSDPFRVAWYTSDTTYSIQNLKTGLLDVGITYSPAAERIAVNQGIASSPIYYVFRDHFLLVGPPTNPANISESDDIMTIFSDLHEAAEAAVGDATKEPVRFLSRYDKSATNIKEALIWAEIGQVPWATAYSVWYHQYIDFPIQALEAAILLEEYTITDRGTLLSLEADMRNRTVIYKAGTDSSHDALLNPAHLLIGENAPNPEHAKSFAEWVVSEEGRDVIVNFKKEGQQLYTPPPANSTS